MLYIQISDFPATLVQDVVSKAQTRTYVLRRHISIIGTSCGRGGESACVIVRIKGDESRHITFCFSEQIFLGWFCTFCKFLACFDNSLSEAERAKQGVLSTLTFVVVISIW